MKYGIISYKQTTYIIAVGLSEVPQKHTNTSSDATFSSSRSRQAGAVAHDK